MIQPSPQLLKYMAMFVRQNPEFMEWMESEYRRELEKLPHSINNTAVAQGRCQVWGELTKLFRDSPEAAAKSPDSR